jgi:hypothetical protein
MTASKIDSARNYVRIWAFVAPRARRRPISERRSRTEMIMMLATPTAPDQCHRSEAEEKAVECPCCCGSGGEHVGRLADGRLVRCLGIGGLREQRLHRCLIRRAGMILADGCDRQHP